MSHIAVDGLHWNLFKAQCVSKRHQRLPSALVAHDKECDKVSFDDLGNRTGWETCSELVSRSHDKVKHKFEHLFFALM